MGLYEILRFISFLFTIYQFMIIGYILMSWIPSAQDSSIGRLLAKVVEPYLGFFRKFIPPIGMIDISPIVALLLLNFIQNGVYIVVERLYIAFLY
ncbi:YggT family protein [Ureibacillus manganicus]|uniref:Membrane protein n=1 Tax=Ureibacillus manganicus DSM 26584 TaxID=1384049 RepID=A0A0A3IAC8_9BACL|nr:YggT family protein [Ureibacillus manganicus]KGR80430.1 membrane protein [Ureibacillus manganicus DSM 26584]